MQPSSRFPGSVPCSVKEKHDGLPRQSPRHNVLAGLFLSSTVCADDSTIYLHREWHRPNFHYIYGWRSRPSHGFVPEMRDGRVVVQTTFALLPCPSSVTLAPVPVVPHVILSNTSGLLRMVEASREWRTPHAARPSL
jgi:hypothetical protein